MLSWILRLLLLYLILRALWRLVSGIVEGATGPPAGGKERGVSLVRDPVCGTFVVPSPALSSRAGGELQFFCSERCRRAFEAAGGGSPSLP